MSKLVFLLAAVTSASVIFAQTTEHEVNRDVWYPFISAYNQLDAKGFMSVHTDDVIRPHYDQIAALDAIIHIDPQKGLALAYSELNDTDVEVRRNAVIKCIQNGDPSAVQPLKALFKDEDFEVRIYAKQGVKRLVHRLNE